MDLGELLEENQRTFLSELHGQASMDVLEEYRGKKSWKSSWKITESFALIITGGIPGESIRDCLEKFLEKYGGKSWENNWKNSWGMLKEFLGDCLTEF